MQHILKHTTGLLLLLSWNAFAQFSPGDLTNAHASLEGMNQCTQCHDLGKKINKTKCLECHALLRSRIDQNKGFHGSASVRNKECIQCHTEHRGRQFDMIRWEGGKTGFSHDQTGYVLEGKHKTARCESCHKPEFIKDNAVRNRAAEGLSLSRTFLGLGQDCRHCHFNEHRNHMTKPCTECHDFEDWKRSVEAKFDHSNTRFPLTGRHSLASCEQCHVLVPDSRKKPNGQVDPDYMNLSDMRFDKCTVCHTDPHNNKFGQTCEKCHVPGGWQNVTVSGFDHSKTNFPLTGKHLSVNCEKCHQPDIKKKAQFKGLKYVECRDCHKFNHAEQFSSTPDQGRCERCHNTNGFTPSIFSITDHAGSQFPLTGSHAAVGCNQCHDRLSGDEFGKRTGLNSRPAEPTVVFRFLAKACADCHTDIHKDQFKEKVSKTGCESCHRTDAWNELLFDHNKDSAFPLKGKHAQVGCVKCHKTSTGQSSDTQYKGLSSACESCHSDFHFGQFKTMSGDTPCERCHNENGFRPAAFDHTRQSRFPLSGAHEKIECVKCHRSVTLNNGIVTTVYKPIDTKCSSCHAHLK